MEAYVRRERMGGLKEGRGRDGRGFEIRRWKAAGWFPGAWRLEAGMSEDGCICFTGMK